MASHEIDDLASLPTLPDGLTPRCLQQREAYDETDTDWTVFTGSRFIAMRPQLAPPMRAPLPISFQFASSSVFSACDVLEMGRATRPSIQRTVELALATHLKDHSGKLYRIADHVSDLRGAVGLESDTPFLSGTAGSSCTHSRLCPADLRQIRLSPMASSHAFARC